MPDQVKQYHWPPKKPEDQCSGPESVILQALNDIRAGVIRPDHVYIGIREGDWK